MAAISAYIFCLLHGIVNLAHYLLLSKDTHSSKTTYDSRLLRAHLIQLFRTEISHYSQFLRSHGIICRAYINILSDLVVYTSCLGISQEILIKLRRKMGNVSAN